jgi:hypothetical protein
VSWKTWSPFQSEQVRDICAHLTKDELDRLTQMAKEHGRASAVRFAVPVSSICGAVLVLPLAGGFATWILVVATAVTFVVVGGALYAVNREFFVQSRKVMRDFLCSTQWAKAQGIVPESLRMFEFRRQPQERWTRIPPTD